MSYAPWAIRVKEGSRAANETITHTIRKLNYSSSTHGGRDIQSNYAIAACSTSPLFSATPLFGILDDDVFFGTEILRQAISYLGK